jgi:iron complex transport system substrate-binding protein
VSIESVVAADPEAIITTTDAGGGDGLATWRRFPWMTATMRHNLIVLDAETIHRASPRILDGADALCEQLDEVRSRGKP